MIIDGNLTTKSRKRLLGNFSINIIVDTAYTQRGC